MVCREDGEGVNSAAGSSLKERKLLPLSSTGTHASLVRNASKTDDGSKGFETRSTARNRRRETLSQMHVSIPTNC